jgi:hypothetical protein
MARYWWVLIVVALVVLGYLKMKIFSSWMSKRKAEEERRATEN